MSLYNFSIQAAPGLASRFTQEDFILGMTYLNFEAIYLKKERVDFFVLLPIYSMILSFDSLSDILKKNNNPSPVTVDYIIENAHVVMKTLRPLHAREEVFSSLQSRCGDLPWGRVPARTI